MKITRVETFLVPPRWLFCRVETDDGLVGWGEPVVEGRAETTRAAVHELADLLLGADPRRVEDLWQTMTKAAFYRGGPVLSSAVAGLDQALWDILGRSLGVPAHQLLGGAVRDRVRVYGWIGGDEPGEVGEEAAVKIAAGLTAVKINASGRIGALPPPAQIDAVVRRAAAVRGAIGDGADFAVDFHGRITVPAARRLIPLLEPYRPLFVEEPVLPEHTHRLGDVVASTTTPIACGERLFSRADFLPALQAGVAVVQPDLSHAGGISEVRRIASLAEVYGALFAPHCPLGPLSLAASLQVAFATPNFLIQEQSIGIHYNTGADVLDYLVDRSPFAFVDGSIERWDAPGLGIEIDEDAVRRADEVGHRWRPPVWRHPDGGHAEW
ncbi:galactonate dehydratase [Actinomadura madurae]|uniref:galactonate dehydratase n=1 Tax=Actinomadura madurae TaxID=1993 RepID=UPI002025ED69|nr:galactonate dehydratase [Actinomadura madurae]MCP9955295.1 galactonate dehydratase [Actinomadura madurae]MCQ0020727.1 galactonate dehydratase [Actinomadura madurae]URN00764.1 galactonate dehydratase [Actinomadura madurae]